MHQLQVHECMHAVSSFCFKELLNSCTHCEIISHNTFMQLLIQNNFQICSNCSASLHKNHITTSSTEPLPRFLKLIYKNVPWMTLFQIYSNHLTPLHKITTRATNTKTLKELLLLSHSPDFEMFPMWLIFQICSKCFRPLHNMVSKAIKKSPRTFSKTNSCLDFEIFLQVTVFPILHRWLPRSISSKVII